jgi:hypothetical protein
LKKHFRNDLKIWHYNRNLFWDTTRPSLYEPAGFLNATLHAALNLRTGIRIQTFCQSSNRSNGQVSSLQPHFIKRQAYGGKKQLRYIQKNIEKFEGPYLEVGYKDYGSTQNIRSLFSSEETYVGIDISEGKGVDLVLDFTDDFKDFYPLDHDLGKITFGFKSSWEKGYYLRSITAKALQLASKLGLFK